MKRILSSPNPGEIALARSVLDAAGIEHEVRHDAAAQTAAFYVPIEIWLLRESDFNEAEDLLKSAFTQTP